MSSDVVIRVENLGKLYRIGQRGTHADGFRQRLDARSLEAKHREQSLLLSDAVSANEDDLI